MKVSIIIVSYNSNEVLFDCLESIAKYNDIGSELEVIIVDNYKDSDMCQGIFSNYNLNIIYIKSPCNGGFGAGNNLGVASSTSDILFFLNPDTVFIEPVLSDLYEKIKLNNNIVYGFKLLDKSLGDNNSFSFVYDNFILFKILSFIKSLKINSIFNSPIFNKYVWPWGAAFAISKKVFYEVGSFDENIFLCNEEQDLIKRIPNRAVYLSGKRIIHLEGHGTTVSVNRWFEYFKSRDYYFRKHKVSKLNVFLWDKYTYFVALISYMKKNNQSLQNYYYAYSLYKNNKK